MTTNYEIRKLPGTSGHCVSSEGDVFYERAGSTELIPMVQFKGNGSLCVQLKLNGRPRNYTVANLVLTGFHGPSKVAGHVPIHINGDVDDNRLANLRWGSRTELGLKVNQRLRAKFHPQRRGTDEVAIPGYLPGYYVTPDGVVTSYRRGGRKEAAQRLHHGRNTVQIEHARRGHQPVAIGLLVLTAHVRPRLKGEACMYRDGNTLNATLANVYWALRKGSKVTSEVRSKDLDAAGSKALDVATQSDTHRATQGTLEPVCRTLSDADADHPAKEDRRAGGPADGVGVDFLRTPPSALTGPPPRSRGRTIEQGEGTPSTISIDVRSCQRCGRDHTLTFEPLVDPADAFTHWASCPATQQPVLLAITSYSNAEHAGAHQ